MLRPEVCILKTDGINCEEEMAHAFDTYGANATIVHVNELKNGDRNLRDFQILADPGGFSYGDDISSGRVLAGELSTQISDQVIRFTEDGKPGLFVCNGFQVAVKSGILPDGKFATLGEQSTTLTHNKTGRFNCEWIDLIPELTVCKFVSPLDFDEMPVPMQEANGEGNFATSPAKLQQIKSAGQVVFRYAANVNGSADSIAALCDPTGLLLGMMPHPERSVAAFHPDRRRTVQARHAAATIFKNMVNYAKQS